MGAIVLDVLTAALVLTGAALAVIAAVGLHRFPDLFARMHAATKPVSLGLALVLIGTMLNQPVSGVFAKLLLAIILQYLTAPVAAHMLGRSAYIAGTELSPETRVDELAGTRAASPDRAGAVRARPSRATDAASTAEPGPSGSGPSGSGR